MPNNLGLDRVIGMTVMLLNCWLTFVGFLGAHSFVVLIVSASGLIFAVLTEQLQLLAKYNGALRGGIAGGYNNAMKIMVINRLGAVLYFFFMALAVDLGETAARISSLMGTSALILAVLSFLIFVRVAHTVGADARLSSRGRRVVVYSFLATGLNLSGLILPMVFGAYYPDFRLTLANTGFFFNAFFTIINVFFIENYLAKLIDQKGAEIPQFVKYVFLARSLAAALMGLIFFIAF